MNLDREYIAIGPNCWGRGATKNDAVKAMRKSWPKVSPTGNYEVWSCPTNSRVGEFGRIAYPVDAKTPPFKVSNGQIGGMFSVTGRRASEDTPQGA